MLGDDEAAASGALLAHELEAGRGLLGLFDDDVLQQIAEAGFDGALVAGVHLEVVGHRALLADAAVGLREHRARGVAVLGAGRLELLRATCRRASRPASSCSCVRTARARHSCSMRALASSDSRADARDARRVERFLRAAQPLGGRRRVGGDALGLDPHVVGLDLQLGQRLDDALALCAGVLQRVAQRGRAR